MAQTIEGGILLTSENFDDDGVEEWLGGFTNSMPPCSNNLLAWDTVTSIGSNIFTIDYGSNGSVFWGAWQTDQNVCGNNTGTGAATALESLKFPAFTINAGEQIAEICFDYNFAGLNTVDDFIKATFLLNGAPIKENIIIGAPGTASIRSNGWLTYCKTFCLSETESNTLGLTLDISAYRPETWIGIDNVRLFASSEVDPEEKECFDLPVSNLPVETVCDTTSEAYTFVVFIGTEAEDISWEVRDSEGTRIYFLNNGYSGGFPFRFHTFYLQPCESYTLTLFDANNDGWNNGSWQLLYAEDSNKRGFDDQISLNHIVGWGAGDAFTDEISYTFSFPCMPECPDDIALETNTLCEPILFTPEDINPLVCPNNCLEPTNVNFYIPQIDTTLNLPNTTGVELGVGEYDGIYTVTYENGQVVRCTMNIKVVVELNPSLTCNNQVLVNLDDINNINDRDCEILITPDMLLESFIDCSREYVVAIFDEENEPIPNPVTAEYAGQTLTYTVGHIHSTNFCWGTLIVEDKSPPIISCVNDQLSCNNPAAFDISNSFNFTNVYQGHSSELPANIAGGTATNPSETRIELFANTNCAALGEVISEVTLDLRINHTDVEDLTAYLIAPTGISIQLFDRPCPNTDRDGINVIMRDGGANISCVSNAIYAISGGVRPKDDNGLASDGFSQFANIPLRDLNHIWELVVYDSSNSTAGTDNEVGQGEVVIADLNIYSRFRDEYEAFDCSDVNVSLLDETLVDLNCMDADGNSAQIIRIWEAADAFGNTSTCQQTISLLAPLYSDIDLPMDVTFECSPSSGSGSLMTINPVFDCNDILSDQHNLCDFSYTYEDAFLYLCGNTFKTIRTWTFINWCSGLTSTHEQILEVKDTKGPQINIGNNHQILTDSFTCTASIVLDLTLEDECSDITQLTATYNTSGGTIYNNNGSLVVVNLLETADTIPNLPIGETTVLITATDECLNTSTKTTDLEVTDKIQPTIICTNAITADGTVNPINISVTSDGTAKIFVDDVQIDAFDNCGIVSTQIRRLASDCNTASPWSDEALFDCCDEKSNPIILRIKVEDAAGNRAFCEREVYVEDPFAPALLECPENDTLICVDQATALTYFGTPLFTDNCTDGLQVDSITRGIVRNVCLFGTLEREWIASDFSDKSPNTTCIQKVVVLHQSDFIVEFPADTLITNCPDSLNITGEPLISNDECEKVIVSYEDVILDIVPDACYKIERNWSVVNWCLFNGAPTTGTGSVITLPVPRSFQDENVGVIEYTQLIKVLDDQPPKIICPQDTVFCIETDDCLGDIQLNLSASDACSPFNLEYQYQIDLDHNNSVEIEGNSSVTDDVFPLGTHQIKWIVEDGCGNTSDCSYLFTIRDCKPPAPVCINGLSTAVQAGTCVTIPASDFLLYAEDNCSDTTFVENSVRIRTEQDTNPPQENITFCCDDVGEQMVEVWVYDEAGNTTFCTTFIEVQDNEGNCEEAGTMARIAGEITTPEGDWIEQVAVQLSQSMDSMMVNQTLGIYEYTALPMFENYQITPQKTDDITNGVSTFDLVLMTQHILAITEFTNPFQFIAADINNDGNITTFDVVQLRQLILFYIQDFPNNTSWRFVDADYIFPNPLNPWEEAFPETIHFNPLASSASNADFIGVKIGDVNGDAQANGLQTLVDRNLERQYINLQNQSFQEGELVSIPFYLDGNSSIKGLQMSLELDTEMIQFQSIQSGTMTLSDQQVNTTFVENGLLHISWNDNSNTLALDENEPLFTLHLEAQKQGSIAEVIAISDRYLAPECYDALQQTQTIALEVLETKTASKDSFVVSQNQPNPFSNHTNINITAPYSCTVQFQIYNVSGQLVFQQAYALEKGTQSIFVDGAIFKESGVYYYQVKTDGFAETKLMVVQ